MKLFLMPCEMHDQEFPWISNKVKTMIYEKNIKFTGKNDLLATKIETVQNFMYHTLERCKSKYYKNISKNYVVKS